MKAIILAAGMGTRLGQYTVDLPKGMLNFAGKSLIQRQVETLRAAGIKDIVIVTGYHPEKIAIKDVTYYHNPDYATTNMVSSLFCAEEALTDDVLVCYSDIVYELSVLKQVLAAKVDIGVTVDTDYLPYWKARLDNWKDDLESCVVEKGIVTELGVKTEDPEKTRVRYVGLLKFSKKGIEALKKLFHENKEKYWNVEAKWLNSKSFKQAYMTDMIQTLINAGYPVHAIPITRGWMEFDTVEDYEKALMWISNRTLQQYISLPEVHHEK